MSSFFIIAYCGPGGGGRHAPYLQSDAKDVIPVPVLCPGLLEPGVPEGRHFNIVLNDDAELVVRLGVPGVEPGRPQPVILLEHSGPDLTPALR